MTYRLKLLSALMILLISGTLAPAAEFSPTMDAVLTRTPPGETLPVVLFLENRLTMDEVYPTARALPMDQRRSYVVRILKERFAETSPRLMDRLNAARKEGSVKLLRPLWIMNAVRITATPAMIYEIDRDFPEVYYIANDAPSENTLDQITWCLVDLDVPYVWNTLGVDGSGVIVGHKDSGVQWTLPEFTGHIWVNPGEDLNGDGEISGNEQNGTDDDDNGYVDDFYGWNFDDDNNNVLDRDGHGTKTASVVTGNNDQPATCETSSAAPGAKLMILSGFYTQSAVWEESQYAMEMGANVITASLSFKITDCSTYSDCPNYIAHRWASEMELAAGIIHSNSTGNAHSDARIPLSVAAPANCPPPAMTEDHIQQGGVSSIVGVAAYLEDGSYYFPSGHGPCAWSRDDICIDDRMPFCAPAGLPGDYPDDFEDYPYRDGTEPGLAKPDVTAPTDARTASSSGGCANIGQTSGATPHAGGVLALIYSAFPGITPEEAYLLLVNNCEDAGDAGFDSLWGFGKLRPVPTIEEGLGGRGVVSGTVSAGSLLEGAQVSAEGVQPVLTDASGGYTISVPAGEHQLRFEYWDYADALVTVNVTGGETYTENVNLDDQPSGQVSGTVTLDGEPIGENFLVFIGKYNGESVLITNQNSEYNTFAGAAGRYYLRPDPSYFYNDNPVWIDIAPGTQEYDLELESLPVDQPTGPDNYGYYIFDEFDHESVEYEWIEINPDQGGLPGTEMDVDSDGTSVQTLPFSFTFYGVDYSQISINENGFVMMGNANSAENTPWPIPSTSPPNNYIAALFDNWDTDFYNGKVLYYADPGNHRAIVEWDRVTEFYGDGDATFQAIFYDPDVYSTPGGDGLIKLQYAALAGPRLEFSVGIENSTGDDGLQYHFQKYEPETAAPVEAGRALIISTDLNVDTEPLEKPAVPDAFRLAQNYPNPFNPSTTFVYAVPRTVQVKLTLYDVLGRRAATVFEGRVQAGEHRIAYDGSTLSTGLYFIRLEAEGKVQGIRKVMLLK